jgi:hypothetical protein
MRIENGQTLHWNSSLQQFGCERLAKLVRMAFHAGDSHQLPDAFLPATYGDLKISDTRVRSIRGYPCRRTNSKWSWAPTILTCLYDRCSLVVSFIPSSHVEKSLNGINSSCSSDPQPNATYAFSAYSSLFFFDLCFLCFDDHGSFVI